MVLWTPTWLDPELTGLPGANFAVGAHALGALLGIREVVVEKFTNLGQRVILQTCHSCSELRFTPTPPHA